MPFDQRKRSGVFFENIIKKSEKAPDYTGTYTDEAGKKQRVAMWKKYHPTYGDYFTFETSELTTETQQ